MGCIEKYESVKQGYVSASEVSPHLITALVSKELEWEEHGG